MRSRAWPVAIVTSAWLFAVGRVLSVWDRLPARMASHFGASGRADAWTNRGDFLLLMALVGGGTTLLLLAMPLLLRVIPAGLINLPNRDYWLTPERRPDAIARLGAWTAWFAVPVTLLMVATNDLVLRANLTGAGLDSQTFLLLFVGFLASTVVFLVLLYRTFRVPGPERQRP
jgi:hypothetical protein